jgi:predicted DNA-binding transcriptional regulator AlpA
MSFENRFETPSLATFLAEHQDKVKKSDEEMAEALGFSRASVYTLIKEGKMKLPIGKVPLLARALDVPASDVLMVVLTAHEPELMEVIGKTWKPMELSANEKRLLSAYRTLAKGQDVEPLIMDGKNIIALITA